MRVLITGGTGTISSGIVKECVKKGHETYAITRGNHVNRNVPGVNCLKADVWNVQEIENVLRAERFDVVVECLVYDLKQLKMSLENFATRCNQYVFISTSGIYARTSKRIKESDAKELVGWKYTRAKIECEKYLIDYCAQNNINYTIVRPVVTYGDYRVPFPIATRTPAWTFFDRIKNNKPILACNNVKFSVIHIDDFSEAVVGLFGNKSAINEDFHIADIQGEIFWDDVVKVAEQKFGVAATIIHVPLDVFKKYYPEIYDELKWNKSSELCVDDTKLKKVVPGFKQKIDIVDGITSIISHMQEEYVQENLSIDVKWNNKCDYVLYRALKGNVLKDNEDVKLSLYFAEKSMIEISGYYLYGFRLWVEENFRVLKRIIKLIIGKHE